MDLLERIAQGFEYPPCNVTHVTERQNRINILHNYKEKKYVC